MGKAGRQSPVPNAQSQPQAGPLLINGVKPPAQRSGLGLLQASCLPSCVAPTTSLNLSGPDFKSTATTIQNFCSSGFIETLWEE